MILPEQIISCDWGTSSFRLRLVDSSTQQCVAEVASDNGNSILFNKWKWQPNTDRLNFYLSYLKTAVDALAEKADKYLGDLPILISGMASSTIGMKELQYAELPFTVDGRTAKTEWIRMPEFISNSILLISGAQSDNDVMRGEEVQLVGVLSQVRLASDKNGLFIFPGTHSKHISVIDGRIENFKTFMTGEMFELVAKHSILSHAVSNNQSQPDFESFQKGVNKAIESDLLNSLFSVRINQLKNRLNGDQNYFYLSGLLIGAEIKYIQSNTIAEVVLCSSGKLLELYEKALECLNLSCPVTTVESEVLDAAAAAGQIQVFKNISLNN